MNFLKYFLLLEQGDEQFTATDEELEEKVEEVKKTKKKKSIKKKPKKETE